MAPRLSPRGPAPRSSRATTSTTTRTRAKDSEIGGNVGGLLAPAGAGLGIALFILGRTAGGMASLSELAEASVPLDIALSNSKPSVVEFYADWCEVCKSMAKDSEEVKERYPGVNFVMLNVDNPTWAEEMAEYKVDGIPHWEYLDSRGNPKGFVVGNLPKEILDANASALSRDGDAAALPYVREIRSASRLGDGNPDETPKGSDMPRAHG